MQCFYGNVDSKQKGYWDNITVHSTLEQLNHRRTVESVYRLGCPTVDMSWHSDIAVKQHMFQDWNYSNCHWKYTHNLNSDFWSNNKQSKANNIYDPVGYTISATSLCSTEQKTKVLEHFNSLSSSLTSTDQLCHAKTYQPHKIHWRIQILNIPILPEAFLTFASKSSIIIFINLMF